MQFHHPMKRDVANMADDPSSAVAACALCTEDVSNCGTMMSFILLYAKAVASHPVQPESVGLKTSRSTVLVRTFRREAKVLDL